MKNIKLFALLLIVLFSCTDKKQEVIDKAIQIHDEVMPKMEDIMKLKDQLETNLHELEQDSTADSFEVDNYTQVISDLNQAEKAMRDWMHDFDVNFEAETQEEILTYFEGQKKKIEMVSEITNSAIESANELLKE